MVSLVLFLLAHLLAFQLYLPTRYVRWSLFVAQALAVGLLAGGAWNGWRCVSRRGAAPCWWLC